MRAKDVKIGMEVTVFSDRLVQKDGKGMRGQVLHPVAGAYWAVQLHGRYVAYTYSPEEFEPYTELTDLAELIESIQ